MKKVVQVFGRQMNARNVRKLGYEEVNYATQPKKAILIMHIPKEKTVCFSQRKSTSVTHTDRHPRVRTRTQVSVEGKKYRFSHLNTNACEGEYIHVSLVMSNFSHKGLLTNIFKLNSLFRKSYWL